MGEGREESSGKTITLCEEKQITIRNDDVRQLPLIEEYLIISKTQIKLFQICQFTNIYTYLNNFYSFIKIKHIENISINYHEKKF